ncbi:MAG: EAL domain-containing protein (putative c-di-GMP-specific phosphodiesterase class I) [Reinekea sp.]|jgi:EAL domain-containing protein (putative c-di-GMP-specific phosphodiesterase class I)
MHYTEDNAKILKELGCDIGHGYLWSELLDAKEFYLWHQQKNL